MKFNSNKAKTVSTQNQKSMGKQALIFMVLLIAVALVGLISYVSTKSQRELVDVLVLQSSVNQGDLIVKENLTTRPMIASEYKNEAEKDIGDGKKHRQILIKGEEGILLNQSVYAANYIRYGVPLYYDYFTLSKTRKNSYLYQMDGELIKLSVSADVFGDMIVPGDKVNIRCMYTETSYRLPTVAEYEAMQTLGIQTTQQEEKMIMLFNEATILDMLNGSGESIFDYYYNFINLPTTQQKAQLEDSTFKNNTAPSQIMLCVTAEEAEQYMRISDKSPRYMLTLLPRESSNVILDALNSLDVTNGNF